MKRFKFTINGNKYETEVLSIEDNVAEIEVNGTKYYVEVNKDIKPTKTPKLVRSVAVPSTDSVPSQAKTSRPDAPKGAGIIKSPLPGVILEVLVREGDTVKLGQKLLVLEAMKMENILKSPADGVVKSVKVIKGDKVDKNQVMVFLD